MTKLSIAIPMYNEEGNVRELIGRLRSMQVEGLPPDASLEIVVCENGSTDETYARLKEMADGHEDLTIVRLSRNFQMEGGMMAALSFVSGDACVVMSGDLQDPPELIPAMFEVWNSRSADHVACRITYRHGESRIRRIAAQLFYRLLEMTSDQPVLRNVSDFRLVDRIVYEAFLGLPERERLHRTTWTWLGFKTSVIDYERPPRRNGRSKFKAFLTAYFAWRSILAGSSKFVRLIPLLGLLIGGISIAGFIIMALRAVLLGVPFPGFGTIMSAILLLFGLLFIALGIIAEYLLTVVTEVKGKPSFIVAEVRRP